MRPRTTRAATLLVLLGAAAPEMTMGFFVSKQKNAINEAPKKNFQNEGGSSSISSSTFALARSSLLPRQRFASSGSSEPAEIDQEEAMTKWILELSVEQSDDQRRARLATVLNDVWSRPDDPNTAAFIARFDRLLQEIGDKVQADAKKKYFEEQVKDQEKVSGDSAPELSPENMSLDNEAVNGSVPEKVGVSTEEEAPAQKSQEELQLWALVDMMVQSKTIAKRRRTEAAEQQQSQEPSNET